MTTASTQSRLACLFAPLATLGLAAILAAPGGGCIGHNNIDPISGALAFENPNDQPVPDAIKAALRWVIDRYPPSAEQAVGTFPTEPIAINLPGRMRYEKAQSIVREVGPNIVTLTPENAGTLPVYHIGRVWIRADAAAVDVFRPVPAFGKMPGGKPVYQAITVNLRAGFAPWRIVSHRVWPVGTLDLPAEAYPAAKPAAGFNAAAAEPAAEGTADEAAR